jgi:adenylate cyclase
MTLSLRLVDADPERQLWSEQYERTLNENFTFYVEIAMDFAKKLGGVISPEAAAAMLSRRDIDPEANDAYGRGIYLLGTFVNAGQGTEEKKRAQQALEYFKTSVKIDSTFARGWAGLAEAYIRLSHASSPDSNAVHNALAAIERALELDDALGEAYFTKAHILWEHEWDQEGAEEAFRKALELNPSNAYGYVIYSYYLQSMRRFDEAADAAMQATRLDPVSYMLNFAVFQPMSSAGRVEEARSQLRKTREMYPEKLDEKSELMWLKTIYHANGLYDMAIETHERIWRLLQEELKDSSEAVVEEERLFYLWALAMIHSDAGDKEEAERLWNEVLSVMDIDTIEKKYPSAAAEYYMHHGDYDRMFRNFEEMYKEKNMWLTRITFWYEFDRLRDDPRYIDLVKRMGLYQPDKQ